MALSLTGLAHPIPYTGLGPILYPSTGTHLATLGTPTPALLSWTAVCSGRRCSDIGHGAQNRAIHGHRLVTPP